MKTIGWVVALVLSFGVAGEARAQGSGYPSGVFDGVVYAALAVELSLGVLGLVTGADSSVALARGKPNKRAFVASGVVGGIHLVLGGLALWLAAESGNGRSALNPAVAGLAVGHLAIGLWNVLVPVVASSRQNPERPLVSPMIVSGRGASGRRWSGVGVQVSGF